MKMLLLLVLAVVIVTGLYACGDGDGGESGLKGKFMDLCEQLPFATDRRDCECEAIAFLEVFAEEEALIMLEFHELTTKKRLGSLKPEELAEYADHDSQAWKLIKGRSKELDQRIVQCNQDVYNSEEYNASAKTHELDFVFEETYARAYSVLAEARMSDKPSEWSWSGEEYIGDYRVMIHAVCKEDGLKIEILEDAEGPVDPARYPEGTSFTKILTVPGCYE